MPGSGHDDDDAAAGHGPLAYWLSYKVWGVKGRYILLAVAVIAFLIGKW